MHKYPGLMTYCQELYNKHIRSPHLLAFIIDCHEEMLQVGDEKKGETLQKAVEVCDSVLT